jgi:PhzF family phenazine biosynthesis protein
MTTHNFCQVDVFTSRPFFGNPVAVIFDADDLSDEQMLKIANWTNLSETTFFQSPSPNSGADYKLRIFHPQAELPFAGHPTIGSAHAYLERGGARLDANVLRMECGAGVLSLRVAGEGSESIIFAETPPAKFVHDFSTSIEALEAALGVPIAKDTPPASIYNGPTWLFTQMPSSAALGQLKPDLGAVARLSEDFSLTGIAAFALTDHSAHPGLLEGVLHIRAFAPAAGVPEDPVTGSANASLPTYLERYGLIERTGREYVSMQGMELGRDGRVHVRLGADGRVEIGGQSVTIIEGELRL